MFALKLLGNKTSASIS